TDTDVILGIYVDDGLLVGSNIEEIDSILTELAKEFKIKITRNSIYVGLEIVKSEKFLILTQRDYVKRILQQSKMKVAKAVKVPLLRGEDSKTPPKSKHYPYRELVESLLYRPVQITFCREKINNSKPSM
ncbi:PREDICTED: uncharacterized protein LOC105462198, partial [Wasmannia auropunctata]|uniref:uncharacterized protein LOC105462198 n=1 Tax=Wasmannia auropunctata TaxID=64793 RepID=UPI0005EF802D